MLEEEYSNRYSREVEHRTTVMDLSGGIITGDTYNAYSRMPACSICFDCSHSATKVENQCSWDASLTLPKGAKYYIKLAATEDHGAVPVIVECPQFERWHRK